jgi:hypothetical protein
MNRHRRHTAGRWIALTFLALSAAAPQVRADAYDGFDYPAGHPERAGFGIVGSNWRGGSGFQDGTTSFTPQGWDPGFFTSVTSVPGSLSDPTGTLPTTGNHVETGQTSGGSLGRRLGQTLGVSGTDVWLSWLQRSGPNPDPAAYGYHGLIFEKQIAPNTREAYYFIGEPGTGPGKGTYAIGSQDSNSVSSGVPVVPDQTVFLVVHFQFRDGNDLGTLYVNPTPGAIAPTGGATFSGQDMPVLNPQLQFASFPRSFAFDELRVGDSYAEVAPVVPEPGMAAAAGIFLLLITVRRRRA